MKPTVECSLPLFEDSKVTFILSDRTKYSGSVIKTELYNGTYYIHIDTPFHTKETVNDIFKAFFGIECADVMEKLNINAHCNGI